MRPGKGLVQSRIRHVAVPRHQMLQPQTPRQCLRRLLAMDSPVDAQAETLAIAQTGPCLQERAEPAIVVDVPKDRQPDRLVRGGNISPTGG